MKIHFIIHECFEAPGAYLAWAALRGHEVSLTNVYRYEKLPKLNTFDMLIVMGGPQSPYSSQEDFPYYDAQAEVALIRKAVEQEKIILGVCLGAQLLGLAYGADCPPSPYREIGNYPIRLTPAGQEDPYLRDFPDSLIVGHWHGDMPGLTAQAKVLASSQACPRQIVMFGPKQYAFQCHLEFTPELTAALIAQEKDLDAQSQQEDYVQKAEEIGAFDYTEMNQALYTFLDRLTSGINN